MRLGFRNYSFSKLYSRCTFPKYFGHKISGHGLISCFSGLIFNDCEFFIKRFLSTLSYLSVIE